MTEVSDALGPLAELADCLVVLLIALVSVMPIGIRERRDKVKWPVVVVPVPAFGVEADKDESGVSCSSAMREKIVRVISIRHCSATLRSNSDKRVSKQTRKQACSNSHTDSLLNRRPLSLIRTARRSSNILISTTSSLDGSVPMNLHVHKAFVKLLSK